MPGLGALLLGGAALGGITLLALYQWLRPGGAIWLPGLLHGAAAVAGLTLLLLALLDGRAWPGGMATIAFLFLGGTVVTGLWLPLARWRRVQAGSLALVVHGTLALAGLVLLVASWPG
ncbi:hypothetical protein [Zavarzinia sp. CC-PAN008]|uniref:hypothetical protein n=1 Tax=Zavarzinia sp. CC-PAN008 TaxID=3243332 RepID=UPI003F748549